tara:strand:- start:3300 stop:3932 length:633 start_codon:yes stop_codon:yes gene_type:complete
MSSNKDGIIIILSSPSGAGKTTLVKKISKIANFHTSISYTTRIPRINELDGKDYFFIKEIEFNTLIKNNELLEYAKVFNNFYGSSKKKVLNKLNEGMNVIFDIDWQGTQQIKEQELNYKLLTFFILPPSKKILLSRLAERENNNEKVIKERMEKFDQDVLHWKDYDYVVINDNLEICYNSILNVIENYKNNKKIVFDRNHIENHIKYLLK